MKLHELLKEGTPSVMLLRRKGWLEHDCIVRWGNMLAGSSPIRDVLLTPWQPEVDDICADDWERVDCISAPMPDIFKKMRGGGRVAGRL